MGTVPLNSLIWLPTWTESASPQHRPIILFPDGDELWLLSHLPFRRRCFHLSGQMCPEMFPPGGGAPPAPGPPDPSSPFGQASTLGSRYRLLRAVWSLQRRLSKGKRVAGPIPIAIRCCTCQAISRKQRDSQPRLRLSPSRWTPVDKSSHLFGPLWLWQLINCQDERMRLYTLYILSLCCCSILQLLRLYPGASFLFQLGISHQSGGWRRPCFGMVGAAKAHNSVRVSVRSEVSEQCVPNS